MFDTVWMTCPYCNESTSDQTKAGDCVLGNYALNQDAVTTLDMEGDHWCEKCKKEFTVLIVSRPIAIVVRKHDE